MTTGSGQTPDNQQGDRQGTPLPRRDRQAHGRIPTQYTPGSGRLRAAAKSALRSSAVRVRPGAPTPPTPEPQQGAPSRVGARTATAFAIRPGSPDDEGPTPDLDELTQPYAATTARRRRFRRRTLVLGTAVVLLVGGTAAALALDGGHRAHRTAAAAATTQAAAAPTTPSAVPSAVPSAQPTPSPTLIDPVALLSNAATDKAPLSAATLFPGKNVTVNGHSYTQALTATSPCAQAASPALAGILAKNGCQGVFRATYGNGQAEVTVGIAVFDNAAQATAVKAAAMTGNIASLFGGAVKPFCQKEVCRISTNAVGRYAYFTVAGYPTGKAVPANDTVALTASNDLASLAFQDLADRGRSELPH
ncbi:hypothetical protein [Streptacidiphilus jiangxiensis]|uniref:Uncharacterized protein n=1 Tax=Streptacidiphilus jiangxiensis TaxID=235985 RepID=A0A1H7M6A5_STRJI|nr:hypothetical protein [Streptacidiphilus jiangxiensis]SEL06830.1 hypothetical protein SAMN05414137_105208 [Streptacidiphilus jiangxiensis]